MKDRIEEAAKQAGRSMNAEIVARLEASFSSSSPGMHPTLREELERLLDEKLGGIKAVIDTKNGLQETTLVHKKTSN